MKIHSPFSQGGQQSIGEKIPEFSRLFHSHKRFSRFVATLFHLCRACRHCAVNTAVNFDIHHFANVAKCKHKTILNRLFLLFTFRSRSYQRNDKKRFRMLCEIRNIPQNAPRVCAFTVCVQNVLLLSRMHVLSRQRHGLLSESMTDWSSSRFHSSTTRSRSSSTYKTLFCKLFLSCIIPHICQQSILSKRIAPNFCFTFSQGFDQIPSSMLNPIMRTTYLLTSKLRQ